MAFIALNAGINFESFDPKKDYLYLLLINTDHSKKTLQLHLHANVSQDAIERNGPLFCGFYNTTTKSTWAFSEVDGALASPLITIEARQSILLQINVNHQLEGFFRISLPARIISSEGGVIQSKSQSSRSITIGHQLSYVFDTTPEWKGEGYTRSAMTTNVVSQPPVFSAIKPEPGENEIDLRTEFSTVVSGATDREAMAYVTALSRDREAAHQDLGTFVRVASMMTADSVMRKNFNQMLRSNGIHFELGSSEVDQSFSVSMGRAGLIGPKPEDPTPPPPSPEVRAYLRNLLNSTSLIGPKPEDPTPPPPSPEVRAYLRNLLNSTSLIGPKPEDPTPPPPHSAEVRAYLMRLLEG
jgi:hypothetical protein